MASLPKDDPRYNDIQHSAWNHHAEAAGNCPPGSLNERNQPSISSKPSVMNENSVYINPNAYNDIFNSVNSYNVQTGETAATKDENIPFNTVPSMGGCQNLPYRVVNLRNGQICKVFIDENNQQLILPMTTGQYELFNNQGLCDIPLTTSHPSPVFNMNQEYSMRTNGINVQTVNQNVFKQDMNNPPQSNFLNEVLGNWEPNSSGTYSPFGQNYPLSHPDVPTLNILQNNHIDNAMNQSIKNELSPKRNKNSPLADTSNKKRIVAEVKPMRPSYSDVLAKTTKNSNQNEPARKAKPQSTPENKALTKGSTKSDKTTTHTKQNSEDTKPKTDKNKTNTISSGSESGDINNDDIDKQQKSNKKSKNKRNNMSRKWSSLDDITNDEEKSFQENGSQFVFIENQAEKQTKKEKKNTENKSSKHFDKRSVDDDFKIDDEDEKSQFVFQESSNESRSKKKKESRSHYKASKPVQEKKKSMQAKWRRNKPGYLGLAQNYLEQWFEASWKAVAWFLYLLSDICRMSAHLSFDLCTSVFTQTYVSSQAVWRSTKDWLAKLKDNKYLMYIDRKIGHTRFGFWRKLKWFKKEAEPEITGDATKLNANIPLPATGEEAMKRLLACKGKDPYSILGVSVTCTDDDIKRYYRRQAFLVHPDKNQQPGAEEAFKILQHAFDLIGEPERRSAYERRALESRHVEAAWGELSQLLAQLHDKMEFAANTIRCTNCGRRHKRVLTDRPCYAARYCAQCKIRHSAKEGDIWAESSMFGLLVMYYACMDGAVYQITQWASCQKKNLKQLRPDSHAVQYRIVLGNKASQADHRPQPQNDPNLEEFLNNLYSKSGAPPNPGPTNPPDSSDAKKRRKKTK